MKRLLVVDDEPFVREALQDVLHGPGLAIEVAADAQAAMAELRAHDYALLVVDIIMPGMNGVDLIRAVREQHPQLAIIAMSGGGSMAIAGYRPDAISTRAYLRAAQLAGADGVLAKPFDTEELQRLVRPLLAGRQAQ